ncbi:cell division protein FtsQ/DivIB [Actinacidiphila acidipaludis]|uniref:Cell division protein FtsQ n=1 Tax=Actinacidiphila acidipaludis TaxID=2873382 RepID=A0ABS7Q0C4_9ACTN|nr:FtsQ-type POTRA domain-containing protein [Streptomyces acidipaludis]MBY8876580.1 FtsQ-type POTRA domain-containing protein [Streptomyces acidipaludis]
MTGTQAAARRTGPAGAPPPARGGRPRIRITPPSRRTSLIVLVLLTVLGGGTTWAVYGSGWFRATKVTVRGERVLTEAQIEQAAAVPLGGPLASVDTGAVRERLLTALPRLARVDVARSWPHTVTVTVTERVPSAVLQNGRKFTEVDRDGVRFATVDRAPAGVPLVRLTPDASGAAASLRVFGTSRLLQSAIAVSRDLPDALHGRATAIRVRSFDGISVELTGGRDVMWGSAEQGAFKASVLTALMKAEPHATHYDVSAPSAPAASGS